MDDNNNNDAAAVEDDRTFVETKIERIKSENPKEWLFSITFDNFEELHLPRARWHYLLRSLALEINGELNYIPVVTANH